MSTGPTVLYVEDEAPLRGLVEFWLEDAGYRVLLAADGVEALEVVRAERPALVDAVRSQAGDRVEVHTPETVKGLEFDGVVVVEPAQLVGGVAGTAPLYIALTRSTGLLELVHAAPLPGPLAEHV